MATHKDKQWNIAEPAPDPYVERIGRFDIPPVMAQVLYNRGYHTPEEALDFLKPLAYSADDNPFRMKGMTEAVYRLRMAIRRRESIAVYGDFDCDGVTSTALLTEVLERFGADVRPYIPDRVDEGYGLNSPALKTLADEGVRVVVTVDCGIRSVQEVEDGNQYGLDMIITDHHSVGAEIPPAAAVINPKQPDCPYPEKMLAGVGLAYKLAQGLYMEGQRRGIRQVEGWRPEEWLDLVAVGTVADIAPLRGENRVLVQRGLRLLNNPQRPGLQALYAEARIRPGRVSAMTIGFGIGPRINAAGRLKSALLAYEMLVASDSTQAASLARELNEINRVRQEKTQEMQRHAETQIAEDPSIEPLLFAASEQFEQGIVGLVASRLTEQYYRPSVVVQMGEEESHGSCRSIPEFHITHALEQCDDLLVRFGGHAAAAGFTVHNTQIEALSARLHEIAGETLDLTSLKPTLEIDAEILLEDATEHLVGALSQLEPTGEANPAPVFMSRRLRVQDRRLVGAEGQHLKLVVSQGPVQAGAIAFRWGDVIDDIPEYIDVVYNLEFNEWNGRRSMQLNIRDIHWGDGIE